MARGPAHTPQATQAGPLSGPDRAPVPVVLGPGEKVEAVGPYRVRGMLGRGGMGVVYEVQHGDTEAVYALKTIEARFLELPESNAGRRFSHEISVMGKLDHPGVVRLHDYGFARHPLGYDLAYFVMEKLEGASLDERLASDALFEPQDAVRCALEVTDALVYLEDHGVLHRDIKPANLFHTKEGRTVLVDFGLARSAELTRLTQAGHVIGTLPYMSPEALRAEETSSTVDVYALGAVLYELLTGRHPFEGKDPSQLVLLIEEGLRWPDSLHFEGAEVQVRDLVTDMLHPEPDVRPTPKEVAKRALALRRQLAPPPAAPAQPVTRSLVAAAASPPARVDPPGAPDARAATVAARPRPPPVAARTGPSWGVAAALAGLTAGLGFGIGLWTGTSTAPEIGRAASPGLVAAPAPPALPPPEPAAPAPPPPPPVVERPSFRTAKDAFEWGDQALKDGRHRVAIDAFEETLELNPAFARAHRRLGDAYLSLGELQDALRAYKTYRALKPNAPDAGQVAELIRKVSR